MGTQIIPAEFAVLLSRLQETTELLDSEGKKVGIFKPLAEEERAQRLRSLFDLEEAERISASERGGCSWDEVKAHLHSLEKHG